MSNAALSSASPDAQDDAALSHAVLSRAAAEVSMESAVGEAPAFNLGGQAIIEGVMMRSPRFIGAAIRRGDGSIQTRVERFHSVLERFPLLRLPFVRGVVGLFEMMLVGTRWLRWSGDLAMRDSESSTRIDVVPDEDAPSQLPTWLFALTALCSFAIGLGLFLVLPATLALYLVEKDSSPLLVSLLETFIKTSLFVAYVWLIGRRKHIRRLFEYHGAEHKVVHGVEAGRVLEASQVRDFPREHPRCGTGFALLVIFVSALFFAFLPTDIPKWQSVLWRFSLLPLVAGVSYETLKLTLHPQLGRIVQTIMVPGTWLQRLTTREPDDAELEVSCAAMKAVLEAENRG